MPTIRRCLLVLLAAAGAVLAAAGPAVAQVAEDGNASPDAPVSAVFTVNNVMVMFILGAVIPIVNGFLLRPNNPGWVKVLVSQLVATAAHGLSQVVQEDGTAVLTQEWLVGLAFTSLVMVATYANVWRPVVDPNRNIPTGIDTPAV